MEWRRLRSYVARSFFVVMRRSAGQGTPPDRPPAWGALSAPGFYPDLACNTM